MTVHVTAAGRDLLAKVPLLVGADSETLAELVRRLNPVHVEAGEIVIREGDAGDRLYLVASGRLRVFVDDADGPRVVRELGSGGALGELALLTGDPRSATVQAVRDSELFELDAEVFHSLLEADSGFAIAIARALAQQLQASGGLQQETARPAVFSVRSLGPGVDARAFAVELAEALERFGPVAVLRGRDATDEHASVLERAEREHAHVVLLDADRDEAWSAFCARQADRYVVVAGLGADDASRARPGADLVVVDPLPRSSLVRLLDELAPRAHHIADGRGTGSIARVARRLVRRSLGVVLSGGGARGYAHIGAIEALEEAGFEIDRIGGCSMGAFLGGMHAFGLPPGEMRELCQQELVRRSPFNDYTLPRVSLIRSRKATRMLQRVFDETVVEEHPCSFYAVSADLLASRTVVHRRGLMWEAVGASMSIPGMVPPLSRPGRLLVDGGVLNNLPVDVMVADDEGPVVAVDVARKVDGPDDSSVPALPSITETLSRATVLGSAERAERNRALADLVVTPEVQDVALREFSALERAVVAGREGALAALDGGGAERLRELLDQPV
jgi:predicted acylesterase/phospholipase RssA/CRP-like cAMP-binding protein